MKRQLLPIQRGDAGAWRWMLGGWILLVAILGRSPAATVETFTGERYAGKLELDSALVVTPNDAPTLRLDYGNVLRAQFQDQPPPDELPPGIMMRSGSRLAGLPGPLTADAASLEKTTVAVPRPEIAWIIYQPFAPALASNLPKGRTGALLPGGDFYEGTIKDADGRFAKISNPIFGLRIFDAKRQELLALVLGELRPATTSYEIATANGSLFGVDAFDADPRGVTLRHPFDGHRIAAADIVEIRAGARSYQPLSALTPPLLAPVGAAAFATNRSLDGGGLTVAGRSIARGFEARVNTVATWDVPAGLTTLLAQVVVPANVPPINKLVFAVYADSRRVFQSEPLSSRETPVLIRAEIGAARVLSLRVEPRFPSSATGSGIWIEPILLRRQLSRVEAPARVAKPGAPRKSL